MDENDRVLALFGNNREEQLETLYELSSTMDDLIEMRIEQLEKYSIDHDYVAHLIDVHSQEPEELESLYELDSEIEDVIHERSVQIERLNVLSDAIAGTIEELLLQTPTHERLKDTLAKYEDARNQ